MPIGAEAESAAVDEHGCDHADQPDDDTAADAVERGVENAEFEAHLATKLDKLGFDAVETAADGFKLSIHLIETSIDIFETSIDLVETTVDAVETLLQPLACPRQSAP